ncbi:MAG: hypothetical protein KC416_14960, partial [Myxococcales bacterium]|nr:hypothetical protein [Myxococcales bacterium]
RVTSLSPLKNGSARRDESPSGIGNGTSYIGFAMEFDYEFVERWYIGMTFEGGVANIRRQTGGPVLTAYLATTW